MAFLKLSHRVAAPGKGIGVVEYANNEICASLMWNKLTPRIPPQADPYPVVIDNLYIVGIPVTPDKADAPLIVDAKTVLSSSVAPGPSPPGFRKLPGY